MERIIEASGVRKSVGGEPVLRGVDLAVDAREIAVLMGPNGAGKTLLLCCLGGGLERAAGRVSIRGHPLDGGAGRDLNLLLQDSMAVDHLTGRENADFYAGLHTGSTDGWEEYVEAFGLGSALDKAVRDYSGGMRRKLELAITLAADVPLYLLDEPTAGLDLSVIGSVHDALLRERDREKAIVVSSHTPLDMEIADTVLFLHGGRVTSAGSPEGLLGSLPDVVRIRGQIGRLPDEVADHLIGRRLFEHGDEARGFLPEGADFERIEQIASEQPGTIHVSNEPPSYVDLFNFQTKLGEPLEATE